MMIKRLSAVAALVSVLALAGCGSTDSSTTADNNAPVTQSTTASAAEDASAAGDNDSQAETKPADTEKPADTQAAQTEAAQTTQAADTTKATEAAPATQAPAATPAAPELPDFKPVKVAGDKYAGTYVERKLGKATIEITNIGNDTYSIHMVWPVDDTEYNYWDMTGSFDANGTLAFSNCRKVNTYMSGGTRKSDVLYSGKSGAWVAKSYGIELKDDLGEIEHATCFVPVQGSPSAANYEAPKADDTTKDDKYADKQPTRDEMATGNFYEGNGVKAWMDIIKHDNGEYFVTVTERVNAGETMIWGFVGTVTDSKLTYTNGSKSKEVYSDDGSVKTSTVIDSDHSGSVQFTNTGLVWTDSDGTTYTFINSMM